MEVEQLSFFSLPAQPAVAVCCMDGRSFPAELKRQMEAEEGNDNGNA